MKKKDDEYHTEDRRGREGRNIWRTRELQMEDGKKEELTTEETRKEKP